MTPGQPQVGVGRGETVPDSRSFTFDSVYEELDPLLPAEGHFFNERVKPLVGGLLAGLNATVRAPPAPCLVDSQGKQAVSVSTSKLTRCHPLWSVELQGAQSQRREPPHPPHRGSPRASQVLAYGQTGSGKTHTMGTAFKPGGATEGTELLHACDVQHELIQNQGGWEAVALPVLTGTTGGARPALAGENPVIKALCRPL